MELLLLPRAAQARDFWAYVGRNPPPRREMEASTRCKLWDWGLQGARGCLAMGSAATAVHSEGSNRPRRSLSLCHPRVVPTICRSKNRHPILLLGSRPPQYLGVPGALSLMGISEARAPALHRWFLPNAKRRRGQSTALAPDASEAVSLLGAAMHWDVVVVILQWVKARLLPGLAGARDPGAVAEHFAGVAVATAAAQWVWPGLRAVFFTELREATLQRSCLRRCHPQARIVLDATSEAARTGFPAHLFLLIAGFPCEPHSQLTWLATVPPSPASRDLSGLFAALRPLEDHSRPDLHPRVVLLENVMGILYGAYPWLCAELPQRYPQYQWFTGLGCPQLHVGLPHRRRRVFWVAIRRDCLLPRSLWPRLEQGELDAALRPLPRAW